MRPTSPPGNVSPQFLTKKFSNELTRSLQQFKREDERNNEPWIHATYYEKLQKCDTFKGYENIIEIDNGTNGNQFSRFCLGTVTNIYADEEQLHYRNHIGKILLENKGQCTWITNCSNSSVFVQNTNYNKRNNLASNYVHKLKPADEIEVFDENYFYNSLNQISSSPFLQNENMSEDQRLKVYDVIREVQFQCTIMVSFIKGWSGGYRRKNITACPTWLEIQLLKKMAHCDLLTMRLNATGCPLDSNS